jgi:hypothetical protein
MTRQHLLLIALFATAPFLGLACGSSSTSNTSQPIGNDGSTDGHVQPESGTTADANDAPSSSDSPGDAAPDVVDNGEASTNYPAPHPPLPTLTNANHGPVLTTPKVYFVFYPNDPNEAALQAFAPKFAASTYWTTTTHEYGVGAISYAGTIDLTGQTPPQTISSTQIQSWVESEIASGAFGTPDPQAIYTIVYPQGTTITEPNPVSPLLGNVQSCVAFGGYHDDAQVTPDGGGTTANYAYAVIPTCSTIVDELTEVLSHEWIEASTDPQVTANGTFTLSGGPNSAYFNVDQDHFVWAVLGGGEAGDLCEPEGAGAYIVPPDIGNGVQRTWSNLAAMGSHDPCVPDPASAFFDSAPVLDETVTFTSPIASPITSKGVTIPVGQSKTIEVDLFSDAATTGPWTVQADDVLYKYYGSYGIQQSMTFAWDRTSGVNGEKLHLTITVTQASIVGNGHAFMITSTLGNRIAVWPGLVVD